VAIDVQTSELLNCSDTDPEHPVLTNSMFLNSAESNAETQNIGMGPGQWPYLIAAHPKSAPVLVKIINLATSGCMVAVADYSGASIKQYRCGIVRYSLPSSQTNFCPSDGPGCPTLTPNGEYAGALTLPFRPFSVHSSNAP
jgi:hypothetical protein